ncbi:MAG: hypothetical protein ACYTGQ_15350, partial [Planctomycetota bacterium]
MTTRMTLIAALLFVFLANARSSSNTEANHSEQMVEAFTAFADRGYETKDLSATDSPYVSLFSPPAPDAQVEAPAPEVEAADAHVEAPAPEVEAADAHVEAPAPEVEAADTHVEALALEVEAAPAQVKTPAPETEAAPATNDSDVHRSDADHGAASAHVSSVTIIPADKLAAFDAARHRKWELAPVDLDTEHTAGSNQMMWVWISLLFAGLF